MVILTYFQLMCAAGWFTVSGRSENQEIGPLCLLGFWTHDYPRFKVAAPRVEKGKIEAFLRSLGPPLGQVHSHTLPNEPVRFGKPVPALFWLRWPRGQGHRCDWERGLKGRQALASGLRQQLCFPPTRPPPSVRPILPLAPAGHLISLMSHFISIWEILLDKQSILHFDYHQPRDQCF